ncbi:protein CNPPD1 isoform X2 [Plodia interpunctella]|nr:protein CNPPD1 isoform X2 [Plodia interpunctella]XP_053625598.1 protein CNPPD1 isoform X2 [Plodia interpunctella]XP_053625600.1 protein CNPPD1 isoform X2 [Plodia interpunctella]
MGDHKEFLKRITKTLYYGQLPTLPCLSLPVTEVSCELWSVSQRGRSLRRLHVDAAAAIARQACVSPCALVLAILYLERLNSCNPDYLASTAPADLFLVSLMVGNKFLQDDGEDEEVICSEWAASGGLELNQLKKLEVEFLNAIDWNVFVNEKSFESGLQWLEKQVALRQGRARGFFTYGELLAAAGGAGLRRAGLLLAGCVAALAACLASSLLLRHSLATAFSHTDVLAPLTYNNATLDSATVDVLLEMESQTGPKCCSKWTRYQEETIVTKRNWYDGVIADDWKTSEPWWSTSVLEWLYQSSLIDPMQRWLVKMTDYADMVKRELVSVESSNIECCDEYVKRVPQRCVRQWLNLSKLSVLVSSVSDR